jgi:hypothetical protein
LSFASSGALRGAADLRFEVFGADALAVSVFEEWPVDFLKDIPPESDLDKLNGIFAKSGLSTGAEAHIFS